MDKDAEQKLEELKDRLDRGEYAVDPVAVADAILRRSRELAARRAEMRALDAKRTELEGSPGAEGLQGTDCDLRPRQSECSYPEGTPSAEPANLTPGGPARTRPIQLIRTVLDACSRFASSALRALGGAQTQSS